MCVVFFLLFEVFVFEERRHAHTAESTTWRRFLRRRRRRLPRVRRVAFRVQPRTIHRYIAPTPRAAGDLSGRFHRSTVCDWLFVRARARFFAHALFRRVVLARVRALRCQRWFRKERERQRERERDRERERERERET